MVYLKHVILSRYTILVWNPQNKVMDVLLAYEEERYFIMCEMKPFHLFSGHGIDGLVTLIMIIALKSTI